MGLNIDYYFPDRISFKTGAVTVGMPGIGLCATKIRRVSKSSYEYDLIWTL